MITKRGGSLAQRKDQAERTRNAVIEIVLEKPGINIKETADIIGIAPSSVSKALKYLEENNLVYSKPYGHATRIYPVEANSKSDVTTEPVIEPAKEENEMTSQMPGIEKTLESVTKPTEKKYTRTSEYARTHQYSKETADKVLEIIRDNPGISTTDLISKINLNEKTVRYAAIDLENDNLITSSMVLDTNIRRHVKCYWLAESKKTPETVAEPAKEENEVERYPEHKNDEGYNDLTAAPTIRKLDDIFGTFAPGAVWTLSTAYGADAEYLVLRSYKGWVTGMMLQDDLQQYSPVYCVPVSMKDKRYVDCRRILTKPSKYFIEKCYDIPNLDRVKSKICYLLGIEPEIIEKIVEKPVEVTKEVEVVKEVPVEVIKEVEKPVEVIKEVPVEVIKEVVKEVEVEKSVDAVDTALLRQKAEIYEKIAWQFLNTLSNVTEEVGR